MRVPVVFVSEHMPVELGSPLKVPSYAWRNWGGAWDDDAEYAELARLSEEGYRQEWDLTTDQGHRDIAEAAGRAGLGDANERLNRAAADVVAAEVASRRGEVRILDVGAGSGYTSLAILNAVSASGRVRISLIDPARNALDSAVDRLRLRGLRLGVDFTVHCATDTRVGTVFAANSFDVVVAVAAIHHHGDLDPAVSGLARVLAPSGLLVCADWHNTLWEHPNRVLRLLERLDWPGKGSDLSRFTECYPASMQSMPEPSETMQRANDFISRFWLEYSICRTTDEPQFHLLEGHRPPDKYLESFRLSGLETSTLAGSMPSGDKPLMLPPEKSILAVCTARKAPQREWR